ncbi:sulfate transport system permease protein CysW [bacterium BMS3Abin01]|nr:sulfate transport system permease protein CysW [bacterium BMS3Abin01]HDY69899.1 ABC transporter permease subunit [Actinomycetota bacterium]
MIWEAIKQAVEMLTTDSGVWIIILRSLEVSGVAVLSAALIGIPLGLLVGLARFPGRSAAISVVNTGMALPPVVVGLLVFLLLSRTGPLGSFQLLYTKQAMMTAQLIMAVPLILGITVAGISGVSKELLLQARSLGAGRMQIAVLALREARLVLVMALVAGMGRVIAEVGAVMMVGGNIKGNTQVMTTAIMEEVRKGNYSVGLALGVILLGIALAANAFMSRLQVKETAA